MQQIEHVVLVMLENRSLDNVLGYLYGANERPKHVYPPGSPPAFDGLAGKDFEQSAYFFGEKIKYRVSPRPHRDANPVPYWDPVEELKKSGSWYGVMNQVFGTDKMIDRLPPDGTRPTMAGFLQDYVRDYMLVGKGSDICQTYPPEELQALNWLAREFGVSDAYFCSVPTQTNPNRAYSLCGTSLGRESNLQLDAVEKFQAKTLFNALSDAGKSCGLYTHDVWQDRLSYTEYTFPWISKVAGLHRASVDGFYQLAQTGQLPAFSYVEPKWGYGIEYDTSVQGWDMHPPTSVHPGDQFLLKIYKVLRASKKWDRTLLIVTFDEHGGTPDHVPPSWGATNPDGLDGESGFKFNLFGVRVPMILASPYVAKETVFRSPTSVPFDHTSIIKTLLLWAGADPATANMGKRMPKAPTFDGVLSPTVVNRNAAEPAHQASVAGPLDALFEGIPAAATREILDRCKELPAITAAVELYRAEHP